ncbi:clotting factor G beta subunit-like [Melitaea cinxia]|uniref:clotting factor G beta subunit-like n=1 Tax=Melitaea cinxia TaxID=113334 RepID=UPI001E270A6B|nr:clotting factor G beta subunit-like [Melitaea cinxia]
METLYLFLSLWVLQVHSMALTGPVLTRYRPCELGVIHFDKITDLLWRGEIDLEYYHELVDVEIEIGFEKQISLRGVSHNSTVVIKNKSRDFIFKPKGVHKKYFIFITTNGNTTHEVPIVSKFRLNEMELCNDYVKASQSIDSLNVTKPNDRDYRHYCGRRALDHGELTSMRTDSKSGDWPWHVAILIRTPNTNLANYQCGGNIISSTAILTAGHCMFLEGKLVETKRVIIEAGISNLRHMNESGRQNLLAERVILHPGYSTEHATSDLAIVVVNKLRYSEYVQPICIWGPVYDKTTLFGKRAVVTGFGTTEQNVLSDTLRSTDTLIQNDTVCIAHVPKLYSKLLNEFTFCAGFGPSSDINPRNGDSGGGLVIPTMQPDHIVSWFLRGILSKCGILPGEKFCDPKLYVVYTDVAPHYGWIYHHAGLRYINNIQS